MFQGELMTCAKCQFQQQSDPNIESGWFKVIGGGLTSHLCPKCAGAPDSKCQACNKFYHEDYGIKCPWCGHTQERKQSTSKGFGR